MTGRFGRLLIALFLLLSFLSGPAAAFDDLLGKEAPNFSLPDTKGNTVTLSSFRGKAVLVNFWATWCPSCREGLPLLNKLYQKYRRKGLAVVAVSLDSSLQDLEKYLAKTPQSFPVIHDRSMTVSQAYSVLAFPTTYLIDRKGILQKRYMGEEDWLSPEIAAAIEESLR